MYMSMPTHWAARQQCNTYKLTTLLATVIELSIEQWSGCKQPSAGPDAAVCTLRALAVCQLSSSTTSQQ